MLWLLLFAKILSYMRVNKLASRTFQITGRKKQDSWLRYKEQLFTQSNSNKQLIMLASISWATVPAEQQKMMGYILE